MLGTLNFIDDAKRVEAAALVRDGRVVSLSQSFDTDGPQKGWRRRTNPVHTMTDTGVDAERGNQGFPHGIGGADDVIAMPLQCSTQWDGLGHIFDHGIAWNGRRAGDVVTSEGDLVTGIEHAASVIVSRGVLLDVGRHLRPETGELDDGYADHRRRPRGHGRGAGRRRCGRGDIVARAHRAARPHAPRRLGRLRRRAGAGALAHDGRLAAPHRDRRDRDRHLGLRGAARTSSTCPAFQPLHQVVIPNLGLTIGEMWDLDELADACAAAGPVRLPALGRAAADHRRRRLARSTPSPSSEPEHTPKNREVLT